jgi:hypothetical protein
MAKSTGFTWYVTVLIYDKNNCNIAHYLLTNFGLTIESQSIDILLIKFVDIFSFRPISK